VPRHQKQERSNALMSLCIAHALLRRGGVKHVCQFLITRVF